MASYNLKSLGSLTPKVALAGAAGSQRKIWSLGGYTHFERETFSEVFVFVCFSWRESAPCESPQQPQTH